MLTPEQIEAFRRRMEEEREILLQRIEWSQDLVVGSGDDKDLADPLDEAVEIMEDSRAMSDIARARDELAQIEKALARIEEGSYGFSEVSGKPIPVERLEALPWATTLVAEQRLQDQA